MHFSVTKRALAGCVTFMVAGCAAQQNVAPQYRLSAPSAQTVEGASMLQRGRAQLDAGLDALAIESFRAEIRFNPDQVDAYNGLAVAYGRIGRNDLAQRYFEMALAKDPMNERVQANIAKLPGNEGLATRQAPVLPIAASLEPIAVTAEVGDQRDFNSISAFDVPRLSEVQTPLEGHRTSPTGEILQKRGVLSARFALASTGMTLASQSTVPVQSIAAVEPKKPPLPTPDRRSPYINPENRVSARLERVSLNEVRLITRSMISPPRAQGARGFENFGDRLALWLPAYMSAEQAASRHRGDENVVVMAVANPVGHQQSAAVPDLALVVEPATMAYILFDDSDNVIGT